MISEVKDAELGSGPQNQCKGIATESTDFNLDLLQGKMQSEEHKTEQRRVDLCRGTKFTRSI